MKRFFSWILVIVLLLGTFPAVAEEFDFRMFDVDGGEAYFYQYDRFEGDWFAMAMGEIGKRLNGVVCFSIGKSSDDDGTYIFFMSHSFDTADNLKITKISFWVDDVVYEMNLLPDYDIVVMNQENGIRFMEAIVETKCEVVCRITYEGGKQESELDDAMLSAMKTLFGLILTIKDTEIWNSSMEKYGKLIRYCPINIR